MVQPKVQYISRYNQPLSLVIFYKVAPFDKVWTPLPNNLFKTVLSQNKREKEMNYIINDHYECQTIIRFDTNVKLNLKRMSCQMIHGQLCCCVHSNICARKTHVFPVCMCCSTCF